MTPACAFCGTKADDAEVLLQSATHLETYICSWCAEATLPAITTFRRNHGWKRIPPPVQNPPPSRGSMTAPVPEDAPDRMRDQAELQELRHAVAEEFDRHNKDAMCPCSFCRRVVMWVKP